MRTGLESFQVALCGVVLTVAFAMTLVTGLEPDGVIDTTPSEFSSGEKFINVYFRVDTEGLIQFEGRAVSSEDARRLAVGRCFGDPIECELIVGVDHSAPAGATVAFLDSLYQFTDEVSMLKINAR